MTQKLYVDFENGQRVQVPTLAQVAHYAERFSPTCRVSAQDKKGNFRQLAIYALHNGTVTKTGGAIWVTMELGVMTVLLAGYRSVDPVKPGYFVSSRLYDKSGILRELFRQRHYKNLNTAWGGLFRLIGDLHLKGYSITSIVRDGREFARDTD